MGGPSGQREQEVSQMSRAVLGPAGAYVLQRPSSSFRGVGHPSALARLTGAYVRYLPRMLGLRALDWTSWSLRLERCAEQSLRE